MRGHRSRRTACARGSDSLAGIVAWLSVVACAEVLGVPSKPELVPPAPSTRSSSVSALDQNATDAAAPNGGSDYGAGDDGTGDASTGDDGTGDDGTGDEPSELAPVATLDPPAAGLDAGAPASEDTPVPEPAPDDACPNPPLQVPVDVVFIVDNSGSMVAVDREFEAALPGFASALDDEGVDYRIILISRHRDEERSASEEASTSVCVAAPLGGIEACPSPAPAIGPRFFHYSTKVGGTNSFAQVLAACAAPDPFGLTGSGWSEWLRLGARKVFIEISDADSATPSSEFVNGLAAAAPAHFAADVANPGFVFHSIVGMSRRAITLDLYGPEEAIRSDVCSGGGSDPANAGETYQELSRSTGGLRQAICPADAMPLRLSVLRVDVARRGVAACP